MITPQNLLRHELIGLPVTVVDSTHPGYRLSGVLVDESRDTFDVDTKSGVKKIPKKDVTLQLALPGQVGVEVEGRLLLGRPADRVKKKWRINFKQK